MTNNDVGGLWCREGFIRRPVQLNNGQPNWTDEGFIKSKSVYRQDTGSSDIGVTFVDICGNDGHDPRWNL